jgi:hypothetical protein
MRLFDRLRRRRSSPDGSPANRTSRTLFVASAPPQNVDKRPPGVTERAQDARDFPPSGQRTPPATPHDPHDPLFATPTDDATDHARSPDQRRVPTVRVDEAVIDHPAPRRALSPAEALHLASGTTPPAERRPTASAHPRPVPDPTDELPVAGTTHDTDPTTDAQDLD